MTEENRYMDTAWSVGANSEIKDQVIKQLKKQGFHAMVDEAAVGGKGRFPKEGMDPLIIFDSENVLEKKKTKKISKRNRALAESRYRDWSNKARSKWEKEKDLANKW